jgi:hypothetical protein
MNILQSQQTIILQSWGRREEGQHLPRTFSGLGRAETAQLRSLECYYALTSDAFLLDIVMDGC